MNKIMIGLLFIVVIVLSGCIGQKPYQVEYQEAYQEPIYNKYVSGFIQTNNGEYTYSISFQNYQSIERYGDSIILCKSEGSCETYQNIISSSSSSKTVFEGYETKYRTAYRTEYR